MLGTLSHYRKALRFGGAGQGCTCLLVGTRPQLHGMPSTRHSPGARIAAELGAVLHACNPSTWGKSRGYGELQMQLGYMLLSSRVACTTSEMFCHKITNSQHSRDGRKRSRSSEPTLTTKLTCFLPEPRTTGPGKAPPTTSWAPPRPSLIKKMPSRRAYSLILPEALTPVGFPPL